MSGKPHSSIGTGGKAGAAMGLAAAIAMIISAIFAVEGGYVNHPNDPGGATNHGITERTARAKGYNGSMVDLKRESTDPSEITAYSIYAEDYIEKPGYLPLVEIDPVVAEELIDTAVNMGPRRPSRFFQKSVNTICRTRLRVDGKVGPLTVNAWRDCRTNLGAKACRSMLRQMDAYQEAEYDRLVRVNPRLRVFSKGWQNHRIGNVDPSRCVDATR